MDLLKRAQAAARAGQAAARAGQAAIELAVFGAILIFILGTVVRSAVSSSYVQNQTLKGMRMAMRDSWEHSQADGGGNPVSPDGVSRKNASVLFVEDRLSPDVSKYGSLERSPQVTSGSGTFSYMLQYPLDIQEVGPNDPIMDVYINGQHFPLTTGSFVWNKTITRPSICNEDNSGGSGGPYPVPFQQTTGGPTIEQQCKQNRCLRNQREWRGATPVSASDFEKVVPVPPSASNCAGTCVFPPFDPKYCDGTSVEACASADDPVASLCASDQSQCSAYDIITELVKCKNPPTNTEITLQGSPPCPSLPPPPTYTSLGDVNTATLTQEFKDYFEKDIAPKYDDHVDLARQLKEIQNILQAHTAKYKLFYSPVANSTSGFHVKPPKCSLHPCQDQELSADMCLASSDGGSYNSTKPGTICNTSEDGVLMYDLQRNGFTLGPNAIETQFPPGGDIRHDVAWQWSATAGIQANPDGGPGGGGVVVDQQSYNYPSYDIDGRLKTVTIYSISPGTSPTVSYEDPEGGDIDPTWDAANSCGPRPGLMNEAQIFTFTSPNAPGAAPTYLEIKEGQLYNPETGQVVRSVNKRYTVDLIQRRIQLSNNTGRFCIYENKCSDGSGDCALGTCTGTCSNTYIRKKWGPDPNVNTNPVERCGDCFDSSDPDSIKQTCFDPSTKILYVRSRLKNTGGRFWITNTSGQLGMQ